MAEEQARHRQELEKIAVKSGARNSLGGRIAGTIISLAVIGISSYAIHLGYSLIGVSTIIADIIALSSIYIIRLSS